VTGGFFLGPDLASRGEKGAGVALWERLLAGPIAPQATSTRRKDAFSTPAVEQVVSGGKRPRPDRRSPGRRQRRPPRHPPAGRCARRRRKMTKALSIVRKGPCTDHRSRTPAPSGNWRGSPLARGRRIPSHRSQWRCRSGVDIRVCCPPRELVLSCQRPDTFLSTEG
jgi:hypothetical protein